MKCDARSCVFDIELNMRQFPDTFFGAGEAGTTPYSKAVSDLGVPDRSVKYEVRDDSDWWR